LLLAQSVAELLALPKSNTTTLGSSHE